MVELKYYKMKRNGDVLFEKERWDWSVVSYFEEIFFSSNFEIRL